jgi:hypothetical protein
MNHAYQPQQEPQILEREARACLAAAVRIARGEHSTRLVDQEDVVAALHEIGWMDRKGNRDYFDYGRERRDGLVEYRPDQVLVALALCAVLRESAQVR